MFHINCADLVIFSLNCAKIMHFLWSVQKYFSGKHVLPDSCSEQFLGHVQKYSFLEKYSPLLLMVLITRINFDEKGPDNPWKSGNSFPRTKIHCWTSVMRKALFQWLSSSHLFISNQTYSFPKTKGRSKSVMREALAQGSQTLRLKVGLSTAWTTPN